MAVGLVLRPYVADHLSTPNARVRVHVSLTSGSQPYRLFGTVVVCACVIKRSCYVYALVGCSENPRGVICIYRDVWTHWGYFFSLVVYLEN